MEQLNKVERTLDTVRIWDASEAVFSMRAGLTRRNTAELSIRVRLEDCLLDLPTGR